MSRLRALLRPVTAHPVWGAVAFASLTLVVLWALVPQVAQAAWTLEGVLIAMIGGIISAFVSILGAILIKFIGILVAVAQFNNFIDAPAVRIGWSVTRDMANMFFIVALLLIAVGTMFRIDQYRYSRTLSKLIAMAILINFSKAIAGFFIDFSQVVMLTFVNAFKDQAAGSLSAGFGIDNLLQISKSVSASGGDINTLSVLGSLFAALIMIFVATVVVAIFTILLIQRIIMLWIYIVLAPTAYMVAVLPGSLGSWWSSWWRDFSQYLIKGPVIAFFLWLALTVITLSTDTLIPTTSTQDPSLQGSTFDKTLDDPTFVNEATTGKEIINYIVAVGMLIAGLQQAAKSSGAAGAVAGKWMGNFNKWGGAVATSPISFGKYALKRPAYGTAGAVLAGAAKIPLVGGTFGKLNARLTRYRQKQEDKDSDWINYADDATKKRYATSNFALTESGRINNKTARESMIKSNQFRGLTPEEKDAVIANFRSDIGHAMRRERVKDPVTGKWEEKGKYYETSADSPGLKLLNDHLNKKSPASMEADVQNAKDSKDYDLRDYWVERMKKAVNKMTPSDFNEMNVSDWDVKKHPFFTDTGTKVLRDRVGRNIEFPKKMRADANAEILGAMNDASTTYFGTTLFKRGRRAVSGDEDAQRRQQRVEARETQVHDGISGLRKFAEGQTSQFGMGTELLKTMSGLDGSETGGFIRDPQQIRNIARKMQQALVQDTQAIEDQLADLKFEEGELQKPSTVLDASGRPLTLAATDPQRATALQHERTALERELDVKRRAAARLADPSTMQDLIFYNRDQHPSLGEAKNSLAHENVHKSLQEIDPDGSMRDDLLKNYLTPQDRADMVEGMQKKAGVTYLPLKEAFEEYLTEGLVNQGRYADKSADAVQLKSGLGLEIKRQAEKMSTKIRFAGMEKLPETPKQQAARELEESRQRLADLQQQQQQAESEARKPRNAAMSDYLGRQAAGVGKSVAAEQQKVSALEAKLAQERQPQAAQAESKFKQRADAVLTPRRGAPGAEPVVKPTPVIRPQPGAAQPVFVSGEPAAENTTVSVVNNITENIQKAYKDAPADVRANLTGYDPDAFNKLLSRTPTWMVLKDNIEKSAKELMKSEKMNEVGRTELQKRITSLGKHFDDNNAPAFTMEYNKLKNIFSSGSTEN